MACLLVLLVFGAALLAPIAFLMAFVNAPLARKMATAPITLLGFVAMFWCIDGKLFQEVPVFIIAIGPLFVASMTAMFVPFSGQDRLVHFGGMTRQRGILRFSLIAIVGTGISLFGMHVDNEQHVGERKTFNLLNGAQDVQFEEIVISNQQRLVVIKNRDLLQRFETLFRSHRPTTVGSSGGGGVSYDLNVHYQHGGRHQIPFCRNELGFVLGLDPFEQYPSHILLFPRPQPEPIEQILMFLDAHYSAVRGKVMIVEDANLRVENDASLMR